MEPFATSLEHILTELERIDLLVQVQVWRARHLQQADDGFQGLYISEREINELLARPAGLPRWTADPLPPDLAEVQAVLDQKTDHVARRKEASQRQGIPLRLEALARLFHLTPFETETLLICLAPELDLRYERLYAYLQDDVTRKRPSVDLVLNLLCPSFEAKIAARARFGPSATLLTHQLVEIFDDPSQHRPPLLSRYIKVDERVVNYLLDADELDARLLPHAQHVIPQTRWEDLLLPAGVKQRLTVLAQGCERDENGLTLYFQGPYGVGKQSTAEALCHELDLDLLVVDGPSLRRIAPETFETTIKLLFREALLQNAALYWTDFDALLADDAQNNPADKRIRRKTLLRTLAKWRGLNFLAGEAAWEPVNVQHDVPFLRVTFPRPAYAERVQLWALSLNGHLPRSSDVDLNDLANKFHFSGGQIQDAVASAFNLSRWRDPENGHVTMADLHAACRQQSNRKLEALTQKITPHYTWQDIVLPAEQMEQLRLICSHVKHRALVYYEWGFDRKLSLGKGLNALFAGPSGTGKTMAAEIIAHELGLDLYKIDLSTVVSKYIGETEKNLALIFAEAETSNAILFFDEADALFGKRSEVKDAHDRYANIEISYLLQKMEEHEGLVILATNLRKNMDDAFVRRMAFTVPFPFPEIEDRLRIWRQIWPPETPRLENLDLEFMARQFKLSGGNIKNVALAAAFLAAEDDRAVGMDHLIHATKQEFQKMGKVCVKADFGTYYPLIADR